MGTWDKGLGNWRLKDMGTLGLGDVGLEDVRTQRRTGTRGHDKQTTPDFVIRPVADDFHRPWF